MTFWLLPATHLKRIELQRFLSDTLLSWQPANSHGVVRYRPRQPSAFTRPEYADLLADFARTTEDVLCAPDSTYGCVQVMFGQTMHVRVVVMIADIPQWRAWWTCHAIVHFPNLYRLDRLRVRFEQRKWNICHDLLVAVYSCSWLLNDSDRRFDMEEL